jgi:hypothetical protein
MEIFECKSSIPTRVWSSNSIYPIFFAGLVDLDRMIDESLPSCSDVGAIEQVAKLAFKQRSRLIRAQLSLTKAKELSTMTDGLRVFMDHEGLLPGCVEAGIQVDTTIRALIDELSRAHVINSRGFRKRKLPESERDDFRILIQPGWSSGSAMDVQVSGVRYRFVPPSGSAVGDEMHLDAERKIVRLIKH